jgi:hypothetical protein
MPRPPVTTGTVAPITAPGANVDVVRMQRDLVRLRGDEEISVDDLITIYTDAVQDAQRLRDRERVVQAGLADRPLTVRVIDNFAWVVAVLAFIGFVGEYIENNGLGLWGWVGLGLAQLALIAAAGLYQFREWELDEYRFELTEIAAAREQLTAIKAEADRRLTVV